MQVLDIGCGQGVLSSALARPAFQQDSFPLARFPALLDADLADEDAHTRDSALSLAPSHWIYAESELSLRRLAGLDVDGTALQDAQRNVHGVASAAEQRWRTLGVQFYRGGLQTFDERLEGFDAIVATEV